MIKSNEVKKNSRMSIMLKNKPQITILERTEISQPLNYLFRFISTIKRKDKKMKEERKKES